MDLVPGRLMMILLVTFTRIVPIGEFKSAIYEHLLKAIVKEVVDQVALGFRVNIGENY